jgi:hypothetical protein
LEMWVAGLVSRRGASTATSAVAVEFQESMPVLLNSTDEGAGWIGDVGGGTRQSKGAPTATSTVAVEFWEPCWCC